MRKIILQRTVAPSPEILQGFKDLLKVYSPSCVVADSQERAGVMRSYLRPSRRETRFVGPALTVRLEPGNQVDCLDALSVAQDGDVIVVDAAGETETSIWGGLMSGLCKMKGVVGAVVDGAIRDTDETRDLGFFIFSKAIVPRSTHSPYSGRMEPIEINVPIQCAGVACQSRRSGAGGRDRRGGDPARIGCGDARESPRAGREGRENPREHPRRQNRGTDPGRVWQACKSVGEKYYAKYKHQNHEGVRNHGTN